MTGDALDRAAVVYAAAVEAKNAYLRLPATERAAVLSTLRCHDSAVATARKALLLEAKRHGSKIIQADWLKVKGRT